MGAVIEFENIDKSWLHRPALFEILLYHSVIRHSSREKLPSAFGDVEREISFHLNNVDPENYPEVRGGMFLLEFDSYPLAEQKELLAAMRLGVEEIRQTPHARVFQWKFDAKGLLVEQGEVLIDLMEQSVAASDARDLEPTDSAKVDEPG